MKLKLSKLVAIGVSALVIAGTVPMISEANNHTDSPFTFNVSATGGAGYVSEAGRLKDDASSSYMYCTSFTRTYVGGTGNTYSATAYGSSNVTDWHNCSYQGKTAPSYVFTSGTKRYLTNYIYESGCRYGTIYCNANYTTYAQFQGLWSPDSV